MTKSNSSTIDSILIREFAFSSRHYAKALELRKKVLREPLGLQFSQADLSPDSRDIHVGAFLDGQLVGCLILTAVAAPLAIAKKATLPTQAMKMRQVAIEPSMQGQGIGKKLVQFCEEVVARIGAHEIVLSAREGAVPFYLSMGYETTGEPFTEVTLPHRKMRKSITPLMMS